jgi:4-amino-4-deoxy-L-arabinose transferase-like glycosyltransferase
VVACLAIWWWGRRLGGEAAGAQTVVLFSLTPAVVAHAGLATTDIPLIAALLTLCAAWLRWSERPRSLGRGFMLGVAGGIALATKFSAIPFFGVAALISLAFVRPWRAATARELTRALGVAFVAAFAVLWIAYRFSVGLAGGVLVPFPQFFQGLGQLAQHNAEGHFSYLLGTASSHGRLLFFPIVIVVKTPIALMLVSVLTIVWAARRWWRSGRRERGALLPLLIAFGIFAVAMAANINAGVRHILPVYALGAVAGGAFLSRVWDYGGAWRTLAATLLAVLLIESSSAHPDTLAYFNALVPDDPGRVLVDSDLDWGQDLHRLADTVRARHITHLALAYYGSTNHARDVLPALRPVSKLRPDTGWIAISETYYRAGAIDNEPNVWQIDTTAYRWLRAREPVAHVGKSIRLYHVLPASLPP